MAKTRSMVRRPRKRPTAQSGAQIVDAILTATVELIDEGGLEAVTTNKIAARAGISVGSLYQYYGDRSAVLTDLARRREAAFLAGLRTIRAERPTLGAEGTVRRILRLLFSAEIGSPRSRGALRAHVARGWVGDATAPVWAELALLLRELVGSAPDDTQLERRLELTASAVEGILNAALTREPSLLEHPDLEERLFELVWPYVFGGTAALRDADDAVRKGQTRS